MWGREASPGHSWNNLPSRKCTDLHWEGLAWSSLGNFLLWGLCSASLPFSQPQPHPVLGSPSSPGRWVHLWFPSSPLTQKPNKGHGYKAVPGPHLFSLAFYSSAYIFCCFNFIHTTCSRAKTLHAPQLKLYMPSLHSPSPPAKRSHPHFFNLAGTG